jgi:hypothetical protein
MVLQWNTGDEAVGLKITGACSDHAHFELVGVAGPSIAGGIISRDDCIVLATLMVETVRWIDAQDAYVDAGIEKLERLKV